jgi:hypothetical protein
MKIINIVITVTLIAMLAVSVAAFNMPSLLGRPIVPGLTQQIAPELPSRALTPEDVTAQTADEPFSLTVSGNVYVDKIPVQGAEVSVYLNGRYVGGATAGDLYRFSVPGVRIGDTIRVDAKYQGYTGSASEVVKFKSLYMDINIKSGRSFIRNALEMIPKRDDISQQSQQQAAAPASTSQQAAAPASSSATTSSADTKALTSQVMGDTSNMLLNTFGRNNAMLTQPMSTSTSDVGNNMQITSLDDAMKVAGVEAPVIS